MKYVIILIVIFMTGCAAVQTTITEPNGNIWIVQSKKDAMVTLKQGDMELAVDNRGKIGWVEGLMQYILAKPDIKLSNKEGTQ